MAKHTVILFMLGIFIMVTGVAFSSMLGETARTLVILLGLGMVVMVALMNHSSKK